MQLSEEVQRKDERIAELELLLRQHILHGNDDTDSVAMTMVTTQSSPASSPVTTTGGSIITGSDRQVAMVPNLSPIEEGNDRVFGRLNSDENSVSDGNGSRQRSGNHSNKTTPTRRRKYSVLDCEQQEVCVCV